MDRAAQVLFVDGDTSVLDGLRRGFLPLAGRLTVLTAGSGAQALNTVKSQSIDVIVTDLNLPDMDGIALLDALRSLSPDTTRIILTGLTGSDVPLQSAGLAHRQFAKPCPTGILADAVIRSLAIRKRLQVPELVDLVMGLRSIPSLPKALTRLLRELQSPKGSAAGLARIIETDVGLTAQVLKIANSGFFGASGPVSSVAVAVRRLGFDAIRTLAVLGGVFETFRGVGIDMDAIARLEARSLSIGHLAQRIAVAEGLDATATEQARSAGLLCHVGTIILAGTLGAKIAAIHSGIDGTGQEVAAAERQSLGVTHADVGAALLDLWGFPGDVVEAVLFHHDPSASGTSSGLSPLTAVHAAQYLVKPEAARQTGGLDMEYLTRIGAADHLETWIEIATTT